MKKNIIFFSNPFGYGPTSKAIAVLNECKKLKNINLHYAAGGLCSEVFCDNTVNLINIDQRSYEEIYQLLQKFEDPIVISSINKFAINVASALGYKSCFIDSLTWMWDEIPKEYLNTDIYFALNFPGVDEKIGNISNAIKVPYVIDTSFIKSTSKAYSYDLVMNIGGCENPLFSGIPTHFLNIIVAFLNRVSFKTLVSGGVKSIEYIKDQLTNNNIEAKSLSRDKFMSSMINARKVLTTPGLNASLESFFYKKPTYFTMPTNLSQWRNYSIFKQYGCTNNSTSWEDIIKIKPFENMSEKEAIEKLHKIAKAVDENKKLKDKAVIALLNSINQETETSNQTSFINMVGSNGAKKIVSTIKKRWSL